MSSFELEVQKYLRSGKTLENLKSELGIEYSEYDILACLCYSQIDSPKTHPIILECRGLVLEKDTWDIVSYPMRRFFNVDETPELTKDFDFFKAIASEKLDGTLVSYFPYKGKWLMATRASIENPCNVGLSTINFRDLFYETLKKYPKFMEFRSTMYTYYFELTSPENRIVTAYDTRELHLLTVRHAVTWKEFHYDDLHAYSLQLGIPIAPVTLFSDKDTLISLARSLATLDEGFVATDYSKHDIDGLSFRRIKVKNPAYVAVHHLKDRAGRSLRSLVTLVQNKDNAEEFLSYFPEFKSLIDKVQVKYDEYLAIVNADVENLKEYFVPGEKSRDQRKEFAAKASKCKNSAFIFQMYDGRAKSFSDYIASMEKMKGRKWLEKYFVEALKLKDINIYTE